MGSRFPALAALATALASCAPAPALAPVAGAPPPLRYDDPTTWLCRPDLPADACSTDLDATEIRRDGTRVVIPFVPAEKPAADCFYVYPTVDLGMVPGNHDDFRDLAPMREFVRSQAARFREACRVFAPLYRQVTIATYFEPGEARERRFALAFSDVLGAFRWYLDHSEPDRKIVLVGHSQGAEMVVRLLRTIFDADPAMRARLLLAMPIGGDVDVPEGATKGGTLANIPICTAVDEIGCVVAYRTYRAGHPAHSWNGPPPKGRRTACVNPADLAGNAKRLLSSAVFPTRSKFRQGMPGSDLATTPFVALRDFYAAQCVDGADGFRYLAVEAEPAPDDARKNPIDFNGMLWRTQLGLHVLDLQLAQGNLVDLIKQRAGSSATTADGEK